MAMLDIRAVDVFYGDAQALAGVSLRVNAGEIVTLIGANGAGKSTTLRTISGLMKPRHGTIMLDGRRLDIVPPHSIAAAGIRHVPEGRRLFPNMTVRENLIMGAYGQMLWKTRLDGLARVYEIFPRLAERASQLGGTLSGGEQQMCAIGRALMGQPKLLMLDEPSLGLAPNIVHQMFEVIRNISRQDVTILLVEQNAQLALEIADRGYVMATGHIVLEGAGRELLDNAHVRQAYLGL
jgi:branched-chain amino acid transport system ATP-binding protein